MSATRILPYLLTCLLFPLLMKGQQPRLVLPFQHTHQIKQIRFSQDNRFIASTAESEKALFIWQTSTGRLLQTIRGGDQEIYYFDFEPKGNNIITTGEDHTAIVWNVYSGRPERVLKGHTGYINRAHFSDDGKKIVTASQDQTVKIWDAGFGKVLHTLRGHKNVVTAALFTKSGKKVVSNGLDSTVKIWNASNGILEKTFSKPETNILDFTVSDDEKKIFIIYSNSLSLYEMEGGKIIFEKKENTIGYSDCRFSPDNKKIIIHAWQWFSLTIRDAQTGNEVRKFTVKDDPMAVFSLAIAPSGDKVFVPGVGGKGLVWDVVNDKEQVLLDRRVSKVNKSFFNADGTRLVTVYNSVIGQVWNVQDGRLLSELKGSISRTGPAEWIGDQPLAVTGIDTAFYLWDTKTGNPVSSFRHNAVNFNGHIMQLSTDGTKLLTKFLGEPLVLDLFTGKVSPRIIVQPSIYSRTFCLSPDGKKVLTIHDDVKAARLWDVATGKMLFEMTEIFSGVKMAIGMLCFTPDGEKIITVSTNGLGRVWNTQTGLPLASFKANDSFSEPNNIRVNPRGNKLLVTYFGGARIIDLMTGKMAGEYKEQSDDYFHQVRGGFSPDNNRVATLDTRLIIWDTMFSKAQLTIPDVPGMYSIAFSPDNKRIVAYGENNFARIWDIAQGKLITDLKGHENSILSLSYDKKGSRIITSSSDNTYKLWDAASGKLIYTFFPLGENGYFNLLPSGFYKASADAAKLLHYVTKDLKVISFEQLDVKYNRPDKVLAAIGNTDTALIKSYRKAWEKRIKKLGIDTTQFRDGYSVPEADIVNRDSIDHEQKTGTLRLHFKGRGSPYKLDRFNIWVNESPLFGQQGIRIKGRNSNTLDTVIHVVLSQGANRIEASITDVSGTESFRMPLYVNYSPAVRQKESLRFVGIGIDRFADPKNNLQYSSKDIRDLAIKLKEKYKDEIIIDTLFNENVTKEKVKALKQKLQGTSVNDKVIVSYSGHGLLSRDYDYYLSTFNINFDKPDENGLPYDELENLLDSIPARRKLMLIDACHSGEVDKEEMVRITAAEEGLKAQGAKGGKPTYTGKTTLGMKNSFELMQSLFVNVGKSTGATIISAAAGTQFALERGDLKNGVFTYCILEALDKNPGLKISELKRIVGERVEQLTNGLQKPTSRNETIVADWSL